MKKEFDAVKFQRKVREELGKKYTSNREAFLRELNEKYGKHRWGQIESAGKSRQRVRGESPPHGNG